MRSALGCAALGVLLLLVAGTFDAEPLYVTGAALVLLGAGAGTWIGLGGWGATIERRVSRRSVLEEEPLEVLVEVEGRAPGAPAGLGGRAAAARAGAAAGRAPSRARARGGDVRAPRAAHARPARARAARPLRPRGAGRARAPRCTRCSCCRGSRRCGRRRTAARSSVGHARAALIAAAETEIDGLREHVEGSPASRIHWPSVARGAGLMERKLISETDSRPLVVLDPRAPASPEALDAAVRAAASLCVHFARRARLRAAAARRPARHRGRARPARLAAGARPPGADGGAHGPRAGLGPEPARAGGVRRRARGRPPAARARAGRRAGACW